MKRLAVVTLDPIATLTHSERVWLSDSLGVLACEILHAKLQTTTTVVEILYPESHEVEPWRA